MSASTTGGADEGVAVSVPVYSGLLLLEYTSIDLHLRTCLINEECGQAAGAGAGAGRASLVAACLPACLPVDDPTGGTLQQ